MKTFQLTREMQEEIDSARYIILPLRHSQHSASSISPRISTLSGRRALELKVSLFVDRIGAVVLAKRSPTTGWSVEDDHTCTGQDTTPSRPSF